MKITDYTVVTSDRLDRLVAGVKGKLATGWELQGGIALHQETDQHNGQVLHYSQAMVLADGQKNPHPNPLPSDGRGKRSSSANATEDKRDASATVG